MEAVIISSVVVSLLVIIATTAIIMQKKSITSDYNDKVNNIVSQMTEGKEIVTSSPGFQTERNEINCCYF